MGDVMSDWILVIASIVGAIAVYYLAKKYGNKVKESVEKEIQ